MPLTQDWFRGPLPLPWQAGFSRLRQVSFSTPASPSSLSAMPTLVGANAVPAATP